MAGIVGHTNPRYSVYGETVSLISAREMLTVCDVTNLPNMDIIT